MSKVILSIKDVNHWYNDPNAHVLTDINLEVFQGEFVAVVGSSGCGKSTLFNTILGTIIPEEGIVEVDGIPVEGPNRNVGIVYQRYGLYRHLTAEKNVAIGPKWTTGEIHHRVLMPWWWWPLRRQHLQEARHFLDKMKLSHAYNRYPDELSGGMRQRVAIAQAMIMKPKLLLLDEPFGALDEVTRSGMHKILLDLYQENLNAHKENRDPPWTIIFVTQELDEAFAISDRVIGLSRNWRDSRDRSHRGATKVWDKQSPMFHPGQPKNLDELYLAKQELKKIVLDDRMAPVDPMEHVLPNRGTFAIGAGVALSTES